MELALELRSSGRYDNVFVEYYVPVKQLDVPQGSYPWGSKDRISVDIVVEKDGRYVPIEIKYKTKPIKVNFLRFGQPTGIGETLADQIAFNDSSYNCWKDIRRLELMKSHFKNVDGGIFLMVTNQPNYVNGPHSSALYAPFSMGNGIHNNRVKEYSNNRHPRIVNDADYTFTWKPVNLHLGGKDHPFNYNLVKI